MLASRQAVMLASSRGVMLASSRGLMVHFVEASCFIIVDSEFLSGRVRHEQAY